MTKIKAWTDRLQDVAHNQLSFFTKKTKEKIAVLNLKGTKSTVQKARTVQWSSYGLSVVLDELNTTVLNCTPDTMDQFDVVLYSVTSPVDQLTMVEELPLILRDGKKRKTKIVVGGQGIYPVWALRDIVDRVHFGRVESVAEKVCLSDEVLPFCYDPYLDYELSKNYVLRGNTEIQSQESSVGCKQACTFCQYSYTREIVGQKENVSYNAGKQGHIVAEDIFGSVDFSKPGRRTTALDGWSEETRKRVKKGVTDSFFIKRIKNITETVNGTIVLKLFQIVGYPWETPESIERDILRFSEILRECDSDTKKPGRVLIMFLNTPFSPEPLTPMEDEFANINVDWRKTILSGTNKGRPVYKGVNIEAFILPQISGPLNLLKRVAVNRGASYDQLRALNRCKTIEDAKLIVPGIWEAGAGLRVSDYLGLGFDLPKSKQSIWKKYQEEKETKYATI